MKKIIDKAKKDFEIYIGSIFLSITTVTVIMNVFTRYFLRFTYHWAEEIAVGAFVWTIFLGVANAFRKKELIGVEALIKLLPEGSRKVLEFLTSIIITILSGIMFYFSYKYVSDSTKITAALEISYRYIYASMVISFGLMTLYSIYFTIQNFKKAFLEQNS